MAVAIATIFLVLATAGLAGFGFIQSRDMKASIVVAGRAARSSERAATISEQSLVKLERAFVFPTDWTNDWFWHLGDETRHSWAVRPIYHNSGSSPTIDLTTNINFELRETPLPDNFSFPLAAETFSTLIAPKANVQGGRSTISDQDLLAIQNGTKHFYIWGILRYRDVFDDTPEHVTTFCRYVTNVIGNPLERPNNETNPVRFFFAMHGAYNSAD